MQDGLFLRLQINVVRSGMIADMGGDLWQTLCVLASFIDENGECWPSQDYLADLLGVSRETVNRRIKRLREYRWNGKPVIVTRRIRDPSTQQWSHTIYKVLPESGLVFG